MIKFCDAVETGRTKKTKEGYLIATSKVARTGVQLYLAREIGDVAYAAGFKDSDVVRVYRHPDEVFSDSALQSLTRIPVTVGHPSEMVDATNHSKYSVGDVGDRFAQDGDWIVVNPMIKDARGVEASKTTHKQISMGYTANIVPARDGIDADFEMTDINFNHLALVPKGRAGDQARIGDADNWGVAPVTVEDKIMSVELKTVILGDKAVEVKATDADTVASLLKDHKTTVDAKDAEIVTLTAKLNDAEAKVLSDAQIKELVDAKIKSDADRAKVLAILKDEAKVAAMSDEAIAGALAVLGDVKVDDSAREAIKGKQKPEVNDAWGKMTDYNAWRKEAK